MKWPSGPDRHIGRVLRKRVILIMLACVAGIDLSGCSSFRADACRAVGGYMKARADDLNDPFEIGVEAGDGVDCKLHWLFGVWGVGFWGEFIPGEDAKPVNVWRLGPTAGHVRSSGASLALLPFQFPTPLLFWGSPERESLDDGRTATTWFVGPLGLVTPGITTSIAPYGSGCGFNKSLPLGFRIFCYYGLRVRIYPLEIVDAVTGLVGVDLLKEDLWE